MCILSYKCYNGSCIEGGNPLQGCTPGGPRGCLPCSVALVAGGEMSKNEKDEWQAPAAALHGVIVPGVGWVIKDAGATPLKAGDLVTEISDDDGAHFLPVNEAWFAYHWAELNGPNPPKGYWIRFLRAGEPWIQEVAVSRA